MTYIEQFLKELEEKENQKSDETQDPKIRD
jgi:hypothetical protein